MPLDVWTYTLLLWMCACASTVVSQDVEGCPSYGCTPTGSFSLLTSKEIPRTGVKVIWTTQLSNSSGTGSPLLGCVSNNKHVVCPTPQGYVGLDGDTGRVLWRDNILDNPTLPIMDVMGDVIGSDGKYLTKIEADGTVMKPFIPLDPPMNPLYSVEFGDENILLLVSQTGELVAYLTNGIPMANLFLRGNVENYNGTFHPIAQPVMNGSRAYILTEFKPNPEYTDIPRDKLATLGLQRLYAVDVRHTMIKLIDIAWYFNFETEATVKCSRISHETELGQTRTSDDNKRLNFAAKGKEHQYEALIDLIRGKSPISSARQKLHTGSTRTKSNTELNKLGIMDLMRPLSQNVVQMNQNLNVDSSMMSSTKMKVSPKIISQKTQQAQQPSVLFFFGSIMVSVGPPEGQCDLFPSQSQRECCRETAGPKLWGFKENGVNVSASYSKDFPLSYMSVYDSGYKVPERGHFTQKINTKRLNKTGTENNLGEWSLVWAVTQFGDIINGFDQISSQVQQTLNVSHMLNTSVQITSRVMVATDPITHANILVFGIRANKSHSFSTADNVHVASNVSNYLVALDTALGQGQANIMWMLPVPSDFTVQGQISVLEVIGTTNPTFVATAQGPSSQIVFAFNFTITP